MKNFNFHLNDEIMFITQSALFNFIDHGFDEGIHKAEQIITKSIKNSTNFQNAINKNTMSSIKFHFENHIDYDEHGLPITDEDIRDVAIDLVMTNPLSRKPIRLFFESPGGIIDKDGYAEVPATIINNKSGKYVSVTPFKLVGYTGTDAKTLDFWDKYSPDITTIESIIIDILAESPITLCL